MSIQLKDESLEWLKCSACAKVWSVLDQGLCPICLRRANIDSELPEKFRGAAFDNYQELSDAAKAMKADAQAFLTSDKGLLLAGSVGCGKTHLAIAVFRQLILTTYKQHFIKMITVPDLMLEIRDTYAKGAKATEDQVVEYYAGIEYLILDDLGAEKTSDFSVEMLFALIDKRYLADRKKILITSNLTPQEIAEKTSDRIASRILDMCQVSWNVSEDFRLREK